MKSKRVAITLITMGLITLFVGCAYKRPPWIATECIEGPYAKTGTVKDEAQCVNRSALSVDSSGWKYASA